MGLVLIIPVALLLIPFDIPYNIQTAGMVMPIREWTLSKTQAGNLVTSLKDNSTGKLSSYSVSTFQRGNEASFDLNPLVYRLPYLNKGDTIATMYSNKDEERLVALNGDLEVQNSELRLHSAGQKVSDLQTVENKIALAKQELATQRGITARTEALYKDSLVSRQQYELAMNHLRVRELEVKTAEAMYSSARTGDKPEELALVQARINSIRQQIDQIKRGMLDQTLLSPIAGAVVHKKQQMFNDSENLLLTIADTAAYVVLLPVEYIEKDYVEIGRPVEVAIKGTTRRSVGKIIGIDNTVQIVDGRQAFFVTAIFEEKNLPLVPGMILKTIVIGEPVPLSQHLARAFNLFLIN